MKRMHTIANLLRKTILMHSFEGLLIIAESCNSLRLEMELFAVRWQ